MTVCRAIAVTVVGLALQGCWFIYIPAGLFSGPSIQSQLDKFATDVESRASYTAIAVAKDANRWAFGGYSGASTIPAATAGAIEKCNDSRQKEGVISSCHLYRVNGLPYTGQ